MIAKNALLLVARVIQLKWEPELWGSKLYTLTNKRRNKSLFIRSFIILIIALFETLFTSTESSYDIYFFFRELLLILELCIAWQIVFFLYRWRFFFFFEKRFIRIICNLYYSELKLLLFSNFILENACKEMV